MNFNQLKLFGSYIGKDYAVDIFRLIVNYQSVSASEIASRLNMHIKTAQDFLEGMSNLEILLKEEVFEKKRPYFRYKLAKTKFSYELDFETLKKKPTNNSKLDYLIRERTKSLANFSTARNGDYFSSVTIWKGRGRNSETRKINLTHAQGKFLYNLPFPDADFLSIQEISEKAGIKNEFLNEIIDIVELLIKLNAIEVYE